MAHFQEYERGWTWKKCSNGLPTLTGKIGLAVTAANPKIVMAVVQSDEGGANDFTDIHSKRGGIFVRTMGAKHGNAPAISIRAHSISARFGSIRERSAGLFTRLRTSRFG